MTGSGDPVGQGFVQSLARPGGNITGLSLQSLDTVGKRLELLAEWVRPSGPIAVLFDSYNLPLWQEAQAAAKARGWRLLPLEVHDAGQIDAAFASARQGITLNVAPSLGIVIPPSIRDRATNVIE